MQLLMKGQIMLMIGQIMIFKHKYKSIITLI